MQKNIIESKILDYLKIKRIKVTKKGPTLIIDCPVCKGEQVCIKIPNVHKFYCHTCQKGYTIFDFAIELEKKYPDNEKEQIHFLKELLNIDIITSIDEENIEKILKFYEQNSFDLVAIAKNQKIPIESGWTTKNHKDIVEWKRWLGDGLNIGVKTGKMSGITILDVDQKPIPEEIKKIMGNTLIQESTHGYHLFYKYEEDLPKTRIDEYKIDLENDGGQVVISPSKIDNIKRKISLTPIIKMPDELKKLIVSKITVPRKTASESIREAIDSESFKIDPKDLQLINNGLEGCCNSSFTKLGGIFRKQLNIKQTGYVLHTLNKHLLEKPMPPKTINDMLRQLDKYCHFDETELAHEIVDYLKHVEESNRTEIAMAIVGTNRGEDKKRVDTVLAYLVKEGIIIKVGKNNYSIINSLEWSGKLLNVGVPVDFKMPFFHEWVNLNWEDLIIIGSRNKYGKTTLAMNIVKRFLDQGIAIDYIFNESGGKYAKTALHLGMKDDDFDSAWVKDPNKVILRKNKVTIFDWVKPTDFARTDNVFANLVEAVKKTHGFLICFVQLREEDTFFAKDQIAQFPAMVARYLYEDEIGENTKFIIDQARDAKVRGKKWEIVCKYDWDTKLVKTIEEIENE